MNLSRSKIFLFCLLAFSGGVFIASFWPIRFIYLYSILLLLFVAFFIFWSNRTLRVKILWGLFFILGMIRLVLSAPAADPSSISFYNGQDVTVEAVVAEEPDVRLDGQKLTVEAMSSERRGLLRGRLLVKVPLYPQYQYGDLLKINCQIEAPEKIEDFAYDKYLARYDIYSVCWRGQIEKIDSRRGNPVKAVILSIKDRLMTAINQSLPEPHSSLLSGILIGARRGIPEYLLETFNRIGITHIIAVSGSNITIIASVLIGLFGFFGVPRRYNFWLISLGIAAFVIMTGASASVVRAGIMGVFVLLARTLGRESRATNALAFTAFVMLLINPKILVFDAGFQLSFLATMGLVYINPILQILTKRFGDWFGAKEALVTTMSAI
ncbi:MAG: ComEC/Rec2 family competence protein, partial [Candidatus Komeilibacteria bacterium]|nr:ComEC/Rec2 family competence protein [Candidatus Komeilibacteria bacterium]